MATNEYQRKVERRERQSLIEDILGYPTCEYDREELERASMEILYHVERIEATGVGV